MGVTRNEKIVRLSTIAVLWLCLVSAFAEESVPNTKLYDFRFVNMNFGAAFQSISTMAGIDIVLAPDVSGKISNLQVTKKSWQDVLKLVCDTYDLTWTIEDKYVYVQRSSAFQEKQKKQADKIAAEANSAPLVRKNFQVEHAKAEELVKVLESMKTSAERSRRWNGRIRLSSMIPKAALRRWKTRSRNWMSKLSR